MDTGLGVSNRRCMPRQAGRWRCAVATGVGRGARRAHRRKDSCSFAFSGSHRQAKLRRGAPASAAQFIFAAFFGRQLTLRSPARALGEQIALGSAIGLCAALVGAWLLGGSNLFFAFATASGSSIGALVGLLLWVGSDVVVEDEVLPPAPGDARPTQSAKPHHHP